MAKIPFTNLKLKLNTEVDTFTFQDKTIEVLKYLPAQDKYDLLNISLQKAKDSDGYDPFKLDLFFHLNLIYAYTNITFTDKQREDEFKLYDILVSNGFFDEFLKVLSEEEYTDLCEKIDTLMNEKMAYNTSAAALINGIIQDLPKNAQIAADIVNSFDKEKYAQVVEFANAANGNRNIKTNEPV